MTHTLLAKLQTYDDRELGSTGYDIEIYDEFAILKFHSNWAGSRPGTTYKAVPPDEVLAAARREVAGEDHRFEPDLPSAVKTWLESAYSDEWTLIRMGGRIG